jgi:hypothetical protein
MRPHAGRAAAGPAIWSPLQSSQVLHAPAEESEECRTKIGTLVRIGRAELDVDPGFAQASESAAQPCTSLWQAGPGPSRATLEGPSPSRQSPALRSGLLRVTGDSPLASPRRLPRPSPWLHAGALSAWRAAAAFAQRRPEPAARRGVLRRGVPRRASERAAMTHAQAEGPRDVREVLLLEPGEGSGGDLRRWTMRKERARDD